MAKGFQSTDETKIAIIKKRLKPSIEREDEYAFQSGLMKMIERYGSDLTEKAFQKLLSDSTWLAQKTLNMMPPSMGGEFKSSATDILASVIQDAGLKLEDHLRVTDQGIFASQKAIKAIADTGFPVSQLGEGKETLAGIGLKRSPFIHQLSEMLDEEHLNSWATISMVITVAQGWDTVGDRVVAQTNLEMMIQFVAPTLDLQTLQRRARYDDRALLQLASYTERGFNALAQRSSK
ncbi:hypothetical protein H6F89_01660 [Cyanobacteria bacterium FACHB-63]|nr:hypothetical protein [Cyanobacteria bacterium FACHB-63]